MGTTGSPPCHPPSRGASRTPTGSAAGCELLVRAGLRDSASLTFASDAEVELIDGGAPVRIANPPSAEEPYLRTSLLPKLLEAASRNLQRGPPRSLSEVGHVFRLGDPVVEQEHLAFVLAGVAGDDLIRRTAFDVADAKGIVELVLRGTGTGSSSRGRSDRSTRAAPAPPSSATARGLAGRAAIRPTRPDSTSAAP